CYHGRTMNGNRANPSRAGRTHKVSISIDRGDLLVLKRRARRLHAGNLSAAVAEGVRRLREEEGRDALVAWLGDAAHATRGQRAAIRTEWRRAVRVRRRRRV